jgi:hypothetical protein
MKICLLLMLIGVIVGFSHVPSRRPAKPNSAMPPETVPVAASVRS